MATDDIEFSTVHYDHIVMRMCLFARDLSVSILDPCVLNRHKKTLCTSTDLVTAPSMSYARGQREGSTISADLNLHPGSTATCVAGTWRSRSIDAKTLTEARMPSRSAYDRDCCVNAGRDHTCSRTDTPKLSDRRDRSDGRGGRGSSINRT